MIVTINSDQFEEVMQADELVIAEFYSESCIPSDAEKEELIIH